MRSFTIILLSSLFCGMVYAKGPSFVTAIGGGPLFLTNTATQNFPIQNADEDEFYTYHTHGLFSTAGFFDLFIAAEQSLPSAMLIQYGFNYHQPSVLTVQGDFIQGLDNLSANTYFFQYHLIPHQFLAEAKLLYPVMQNIYPYVFGGVGASINTASQYSTTVPPFITFTRQYQSHRMTSFSYTVGIGVDLEIKPTWRFGVAWRFNDFGALELGAASINSIPVNNTLSLAHAYANEVLFQLTKVW